MARARRPGIFFRDRSIFFRDRGDSFQEPSIVSRGTGPVLRPGAGSGFGLGDGSLTARWGKDRRERHTAMAGSRRKREPTECYEEVEEKICRLASMKLYCIVYDVY